MCVAWWYTYLEYIWPCATLNTVVYTAAKNCGRMLCVRLFKFDAQFIVKWFQNSMREGGHFSLFTETIYHSSRVQKALEFEILRVHKGKSYTKTHGIDIFECALMREHTVDRNITKFTPDHLRVKICGHNKR